jgi:hypothetical protein
VTAAGVTLDAASATAYGAITHKFTARITGSLMGQYQHSKFRGGGANNQSDNMAFLGANLGYEINKFLTAEAGYNFDALSSQQAGRDYHRNRLYLGLKASY